jgi:hypothetical protein
VVVSVRLKGSALEEWKGEATDTMMESPERSKT